MKNLKLQTVINKNDQNTKEGLNQFSSEDFLTKEELSMIKGGEGDDDPVTIVVGEKK
jgi:hypothetical protein